MIEALYLHIPFCVSRCAYCDFATNACADEQRMDAYVEALCLQLRRAAKAGLLGQCSTRSISAAGTPTHLGSRRLNPLEFARFRFRSTSRTSSSSPGEVNPESIDERMVADLFSLGVNRFSIGAQSFDDAVLAAYRQHSRRRCNRSRLSPPFAPVPTTSPSTSSVGVQARAWNHGRRICATQSSADVPHVSIYPLTLEDGTPLTRRRRGGGVRSRRRGHADRHDARSRAHAHSCGVQNATKSPPTPSQAPPPTTTRRIGRALEYLGLGAGASSMLSAETAERAIDAGLFDVGNDDIAEEAGWWRSRSDSPELARERRALPLVRRREASPRGKLALCIHHPAHSNRI